MLTLPACLEFRLQRLTTCVSAVGENCAAKLPAMAMSFLKFMKDVPATTYTAIIAQVTQLRITAATLTDFVWSEDLRSALLNAKAAWA